MFPSEKELVKKLFFEIFLNIQEIKNRMNAIKKIENMKKINLLKLTAAVIPIVIAAK